MKIIITLVARTAADSGASHDRYVTGLVSQRLGRTSFAEADTFCQMVIGSFQWALRGVWFYFMLLIQVEDQSQ